MISSEIANTGYSALTRFGAVKKSKATMVNPKPLVAADSVNLGGNSLEGEWNGSHGGTIRHNLSLNATMLPLGSSRQSLPTNSGSAAEIAPKTQVTKYANPPAIDYHGQSWNIR